MKNPLKTIQDSIGSLKTKIDEEMKKATGEAAEKVRALMAGIKDDLAHIDGRLTRLETMQLQTVACLEQIYGSVGTNTAIQISMSEHIGALRDTAIIIEEEHANGTKK